MLKCCDCRLQETTKAKGLLVQIMLENVFDYFNRSNNFLKLYCLDSRFNFNDFFLIIKTVILWSTVPSVVSLPKNLYTPWIKTAHLCKQGSKKHIKSRYRPMFSQGWQPPQKLAQRKLRQTKHYKRTVLKNKTPLTQMIYEHRSLTQSQSFHLQLSTQTHKHWV